MRKLFLIMFGFAICFSAYSESNFDNFTGKILGSKVRLRCGSDLDSHIIKELKKGELLLVVGEDNDFYKVSSPFNMKVFIFRSYVIDNVVEANRVNIRLQPTIDAPIIGQLQNGAKIDGNILENNNKWLEITPPENVNFYVSKEFVQKVGNSQYIFVMQQRKEDASKLLNEAYFITQGECKKPFNEMSPKNAINKFEAIIKNYSDFPEFVENSKEGLSLLQDNFLQKKIAYLESKAKLNEEERKELANASKEKENLNVVQKKISQQIPKEEVTKAKFTDIASNIKNWLSIEEGIYLSWKNFHSDKSEQDFYHDQRINGTILLGSLSPYNEKVKNIPGDYMLYEDGMPIAYLYSTHVNLEKYVDKNISINVSPRPNNNFAFPAFFVNSVE